VTDQTNDNLNSPYVDQRHEGVRWLRFSDFVEDEFLQYYAQSTVNRARLMPILAMMTSCVNIGVMLASDGSSGIMLLFNIFLVLPMLGATLYASARVDWHRLYQLLLATSALLIGMWITSLVTRASLQGMQYYFAAEIAWLFVVWLILGLPFRHAAAVSLLISFSYVAGNLSPSFETQEVIFAGVMLLLVNAIGGLSCYQLEYAVRRSFLESKVLGQLAERDGLTGLFNRRSYEKQIERIWRQSRREQTQLAVMLIDIDHFKAFNDYYGHQAGDDALKTVADVISKNAQRPLDYAARFGGEEFALILYDPADQYGSELPEKLREDVRNCKIAHDTSPTDQYLTVSVGVAMVLPDSKRSMAGAIQMADEALYQAKEEGRNKVVIQFSDDSHFETGRFRPRKKALA
jgi:diguanylate cyclase (GGDEF)-like protein